MRTWVQISRTCTKNHGVIMRVYNSAMQWREADIGRFWELIVQPVKSTSELTWPSQWEIISKGEVEAYEIPVLGFWLWHTSTHKCWRTGTEEQLDIVGERSSRDWTVLTSPVSWCGKMEELKWWQKAFLRERLVREDKASQNWRIRTRQRKDALHKGI